MLSLFSHFARKRFAIAIEAGGVGTFRFAFLTLQKEFKKRCGKNELLKISVVRVWVCTELISYMEYPYHLTKYTKITKETKETKEKTTIKNYDKTTPAHTHTLLPAGARSSLDGKGSVSAAAVIASNPAMCEEAAVVVTTTKENSEKW